MILCNNCNKSNKDNAIFCAFCATPFQFSSDEPLQSGTILENRYKIINLVKAGGMGAIYKAQDNKLDCICAVKELLPLQGNPQKQTQAEEWFKREAKLLARLDHANLPKVSDYFISHGRYYLVMTFIEGEDLDTKLLREGNPGLSEDKVVEWARQILDVLHYLHSQKPPVIYRDIKPANIMVHKDGRAMLIDFGIARTIHQDRCETKKTVIGTNGYAPIEQCRGNAEPRSDLYALGATMHQLLTGIEPLPFRFQPLRKINPSFSQKLEAAVMKALQDNVSERFSTAKEMLEVLTFKRKTSGLTKITDEKGKSTTGDISGKKTYEVSDNTTVDNVVKKLKTHGSGVSKDTLKFLDRFR